MQHVLGSSLIVSGHSFIKKKRNDNDNLPKTVTLKYFNYVTCNYIESM